MTHMDTTEDIQALVTKLRFRHLRVLITLDESGSMHRAADLLCLTQPAVTKILLEVESAIGVQLFERSAHGVVATPSGRCVIRYARVMSAELARMSAEVRALEAGQGGTVSLGAVAGAFPTIAVRAVINMQRNHPGITVKLREGTSASLLADLSEGLLDVAICRTAVCANPDIFDRVEFGAERIAVVAGPDSPLSRGGVSSLADLCTRRWVLYPNRMPAQRLLERELMEQGLEMPTHPIEASSTFVTILLLNADPGLVSLVSRETAEIFAAKRLVSILPVTIRARTEPYELVTRRGSDLSPSAGLLIDALKRSARQQTREAEVEDVAP
ncbi:MAG: LysR family transcriptional regulator [Castellaniella sp.]|nr:MAG: LysR family transcriptional regulator [Castellaniella sp.]